VGWVKQKVTRLAVSLLGSRFRRVKVETDCFTICGLRVLMSVVGEVRLVVPHEADGFHFYISNWVDWTDRRVLEAYKVRQSI